MIDTSDLVARARGLSGHLLEPAQLTQLASASPPQLVAQLVSLGLVPPGTPVHDVRAQERALQATATERLRCLSGWAGSRRDVLAPLFLDEDRALLRALVRHIVAGTPPDARLTGLVPTQTLPMRALRTLAACGDVVNLAALLIAWRNPFGAALATEAARPRPELFRLELALVRAFATAAQPAARHDRLMRTFIQHHIDFENLWTMFVLTAHRVDAEPATLFVPDGCDIQLDDLAFAVQAVRRADVVARLAPRVAGTPLGSALEAIHARAGEADTELDAAFSVAEDAAAHALLHRFVSLARYEPTSLAPVIAFVLRQRAELHTLMRLVWSASLGVPTSYTLSMLDSAHGVRP